MTGCVFDTPKDTPKKDTPKDTRKHTPKTSHFSAEGGRSSAR
jgi:hypothetical protein